jgi:hypothetical protein
LDVPLVHKIADLYRFLYRISSNLPKRDKLGIWRSVETVCLAMHEQAIAAAFAQKPEKIPILHNLRVKTEIVKHLVRNAFELNVIRRGAYFQTQEKLREISKMATGWINYLERK